MSQLTMLAVTQWHQPLDPATIAKATRELEAGNVLFLPQLEFALTDNEKRFLSPAWSDGKSKNVSYEPIAARIRHTSAAGADCEQLATMMARYAQQARELVSSVCPGYASHLRWGLGSFRPVEARGRASSRTKDDTRLHVDAFASRPSQGQRILRVFCNINPHGEPRVWELGEPFEAVVQRFGDRVARQWPGSAWLLERTHVTRGRRSAYDHIMLNLHDMAKRDDAYQRSAPRTRVEFPARSAWIAFTDRVTHAALAGQFVMEQTFFLPLAAMQDANHAPLRILEQLYHRKLA